MTSQWTPEIGPRKPRVGVEAVTSRQWEILQLVADGLSNREIAERLWITTNTVKEHLLDATKKLGVHGRAAGVAVGFREGKLS